MYRGGGGRGAWRGGPARGEAAYARGGYARGGGGGGGGFYKRPAPPAPAGSSHRQWKRVRPEDGPQLPVLAHRQALLEAVEAHAAVVVSGDTGCGKSTQVPQFLLDAHPSYRVACTQPRRIAAKTLAQRVSRERAKQLGQEVGYAVSRDQAVTRGTTRCTFLTVGLLLQMLMQHHRGEGGGGWRLPYTHVVVDEAHERSCDMDLLLLLLRRVVHEQAQARAEEQAQQQAQQPEGGAVEPAAGEGGAGVGVGAGDGRLRVVVMSATIDVQRLAAYLATPPPLSCVDGVSGLSIAVERPRLAVPLLHVGGSLHGVAVCHLEDLLHQPGGGGAEGAGGGCALPAELAGAVQREIRNSQPAPHPLCAPPKAVRLHPQLWALVAALIRQLPLLAPGLCAAAASREAGGGVGAPADGAAAPASEAEGGRRGELCSELPPMGSTLVFLPGVAEISELMRALDAPAEPPPAPAGGAPASAAARAACCARLVVRPLHALLEPAEQDAALAPPEPGCRSVILSTNVGESSITVPGVSYVLDLGLEKLPFYDARANMDALLLARTSLASAQQRAGRCGRLGPGLCLRLFSRALLPVDAPAPDGGAPGAPAGEEGRGGRGEGGWASGRMERFAVPEMARTSLANLVLKAKLIQPGSGAAQLLAEALQPPEAAHLTSATAELVGLGALSGGGRAVTPLGALVAALPCSAQMGRLCALGDALGLGRQAALLAAALSLPDPFVQPFRQPQPQPQPGEGEGGGLPCAQLAEWQFAAADVQAYRRRLELFAQGGHSEPLAVLAAHGEWQRLLQADGPGAAGRYCKAAHLSYKRLVELDCLARELGNRLAAQRHALGMPASQQPAGAGSGGRAPALALLGLLVLGFAPQFAAAQPTDRPLHAQTDDAPRAPADATAALAAARAASGSISFRALWHGRRTQPGAEPAAPGGADEAAAARALLSAASVSATLAPCGPIVAVEIQLSAEAGAEAGPEGAAEPPRAECDGLPPGGDAGCVGSESGPLGGPLCVGRVTVRFASQQCAQLALRMCGLKGSLPLLPPGCNPHAHGAHGGGRGGEPVASAAAAAGNGGAAPVGEGCAPPLCLLPAGQWLSLSEPCYLPQLRFRRQAVAAAPGGGAHSVEPYWQSGGCALADPPPPLRAQAEPQPGGERSRYLLAAAWSGAGSSKRRQLAHWPTLLPAQPAGVQELLMLSLTRRALLIPNRARSRVVGAWLGSGDDALGVVLPQPLLGTDVDEINSLRAALTAAAGAPADCPLEGPLAHAQQQPPQADAPARPAPAGALSGAAVQARLLALLAKPRPPASDADRAQAEAAVGLGLEAVRKGSDGGSAIDAGRAAECVRLGQDGGLLPPLVSPLYDYSPEEMDGFR